MYHYVLIVAIIIIMHKVDTLDMLAVMHVYTKKLSLAIVAISYLCLGLWAKIHNIV